MADNDGNDNGRRPPRGRPDPAGLAAARGRSPVPQRRRQAVPGGKGGDGDRAPRDDSERPFRKPRFGGDKPAQRRFADIRSGDDRPRTPWRASVPQPDEAGGRQVSDRPRDDRPPRPRAAEVPAPPPEPTEERIAKVIARAGIASRRDAEAMIARGPRDAQRRGARPRRPSTSTAEDRITIDGEPLPPAASAPACGSSTSRAGSSPPRAIRQGRATVFEQPSRGPAARRGDRPARYQHRGPAPPHQ